MKFRRVIVCLEMMLFLFLFTVKLNAQNPDDSGVVNRIIFLGDAGTISTAQTKLIQNAASKVLQGKTTVFYLGNNIFPKGMNDDEDTLSKGANILSSQFQPMLKAGAVVYFLPGNRDWGNGNPDGLSRLLVQSQYLLEQNDSLLKMTPANGCPDPEIISISDNLAVITLNTEWWLYPYDKNYGDTSECACKTESNVLNALRSLIFENKEKTIILATHHPLIDYGRTAGNLPSKVNLFPLTEANPSLYIPLPVLGTLYDLFQKAFPRRENIHNANYQQMRRQILNVFHGFPNLIIASSHEDGAQLIKGPDINQLQIVTGIGNKKGFTKKKSNTLFNNSLPGYVIADVMAGGRIDLKFYNYFPNGISESYSYLHEPQNLNFSGNKVYTPIPLGEDSMVVSVHPEYNEKSGFFKFLLGKNYRKIWATPVKLPVLRLSQMDGGLSPEKLGGGFQTISLRLKNSSGDEYQLRSINKIADKLIPPQFRSSLTRNILMDAFSSQHPYAPLAVPAIANAVGVPHASPVIGVVSASPGLGEFESLFADRVNSIEKREPAGKSVSFVKGIKELAKDNDNTYDGTEFLRARMLDLLIGDWDRHGDQWRFHDTQKGKGKNYLIVPRDRDQVFSVTKGLLGTIVRYFLIVPHVYGFKSNLLPETKQYLSKSRFLEAYPAGQIDYKTWMNTANQVKNELTDSVLESGIAALPQGLDPKENATILSILKNRRDQIPAAMDKYYRFTNKIVDIRGSDKNEFVSFTANWDTLFVTMYKINKEGVLKKQLMSKAFPSSITKEIRLFQEKGNDSVFIDNPTKIRIRLIGGKTPDKTHKAYFVEDSRNKIDVYDHKEEHYYGETDKLKLHISKKKANTAFTPVNPYNDLLPLLTASVNKDDGFLLGLGARFIKRGGFRKDPYSSVHKVMLTHSFSTSAFDFTYSGDWVDVIGKAHFVLNANAKAPDNTQNFFGVGNETPFDKTGDYKRFYRSRFNLYTVNPSLTWTGNGKSSFDIGPALEYYHFNFSDSAGRFITHPGLLHSSDSATILQDKIHLGFISEYSLDYRNNKILPTGGTYFKIGIQGYAGLNTFSRSFGQINSEVAYYRSLNAKQTIVLADRIGGAYTIGHPAFYQYAFLGGEGNLLGYRKFRFAGMKSIYNNLVLRLALANFGNSLTQGEIGISGFYDVGRVWADNEKSGKWHNGVGGSVYIAPAYAFVIQTAVAHSPEGWYPFLSMGFRF